MLGKLDYFKILLGLENVLFYSHVAFAFSVFVLPNIYQPL